MKKSKTLSIVLILILLFSLCIIGGCSRIDPGTIENIIGTYELKKYTKSYVGEENKLEEDLLKDRQIKMYLVLTEPIIGKNAENKATAIGYLYYQDIETPAFCKEIKITYKLSYNVEQAEDEVQTFSYNTENNGESYRTLKVGWRDIGYLNKEQALNVNEPFPSVFKKEYRENVYFKKVSDVTDTSFIKTKVGDVNVEKYLKNKLETYYLYTDNFYDLSDEEYKQYIYVYIVISEDKQTATRYYATKDEKTKETEYNLPITYTVSEDGTEYIKAKIGETEYQLAGEQLIMIARGNSAPVFDTYQNPVTDNELNQLIENYKNYLEMQNS